MMMKQSTRDAIRNVYAPLCLFVGDSLAVSASLLCSFWLRYSQNSPLFQLGIDLPASYLSDYLPLLAIGASLLILTFIYFNLYDASSILRKLHSYSLIIKGLSFWGIAFLGITLALKFEPPISRLFTLYAYLLSVLFMFCWRSMFYNTVMKSKVIMDALRDRAVIVGMNQNFLHGVSEVTSNPCHPLVLLGYLNNSPIGIETDNFLRHLGKIADLDTVIARDNIQVVILADMDQPKELMSSISRTCERNYVKLKLVPSVFEILLSGLKMETLGSIPMMGIDNLSINKTFYRFAKRAIDIVGAIAGLVCFSPTIALSAILIRRESKGSPFFIQNRVGIHHKEFKMYKMRSMVTDSNGLDDQHQSTREDDPRLLKIGRFLRHWNLDEVPQFWNVLKGEMSLVGPRPERPHHVSQLSESIPHYMPRHLAKPGMTGWAQVNGLRGNCSLEKRIQHDIYYIENWSLYFDFQIMILTFLKWKNVDV